MSVSGIALFLCTVVGVYEVVAWAWDPLGVHVALNDGKEMEGVMATALINGMLPFLCGVALYRQWRGLSSFLVPFFITFTFMQWAFWWWPYLLGAKAGLADMVAEHKLQLQDLDRWLPPRGDNLVPDIEHTILMPLSIATLLFVVLAYKQNGTTGAGQRVFFMLFSVIFTAIVSVAVISAADPSRELGLMLVMASILFTALMTTVSTPRLDNAKKNQ